MLTNSLAGLPREILDITKSFINCSTRMQCNSMYMHYAGYRNLNFEFESGLTKHHI